MGQDLFKHLPSEIILDILSRLPARTTVTCKLVCKPWLDLILTPEFVKAHISKLVPGLAIFLDGEHPKPYKAFEFVDELNPKSRVRCRWNMISNFNLPCNEPLYTSADGLLFLCTQGMVSRDINMHEPIMWPRDLFICNPITREYIKLPCPPESSSSTPRVQLDTFGFGVSRMSGQYKLVRIFHEWMIKEGPMTVELAQSMCQVYTVGSGSWSRIASAGPFKYEGNTKGAFLNGNLHWMVRDFEGSSLSISCFDLEIERFSTISSLPCHDDREDYMSISVLEGCLCLCDNSSDDNIAIWLMKDYGNAKSWTKEFVIRKINLDYSSELIRPIKAFKNGDILMALDSYHRLLYFSNRTKTIRDVDVFGLKNGYCIRAITYSPSFLPPKSFAVEDVSSF